MKKLFILTLLISACVPTAFVQVVPRSDVPQGATQIQLRETTPEKVKEALVRNHILFTSTDNGLHTEEFLIDDGTRAKFVVTEFEGVVQVVPYWGITDKVRNQMYMLAGVSAMNYASNELMRVVYKKAEKRPKMVFDYAAQVFSGTGLMAYK